MLVRKVEVRCDVAAAIGAEVEHRVAATVHLPDPARFPQPRQALFAFPGGGYSRHYYDMRLPGYEDYSQAAHHAERGLIVVACDHLGIGDSSREDGVVFPLETVAAANAAAVRDIVERLVSGRLCDDYPALPQLTALGAGHSFGAMLLALMQWRHAPFDGIAILGQSAIETILPQPTPELAEATRVFSAALANAALGAAVTIPPAPPTDFGYCFHWDDVPAALITAESEDKPLYRGVRREWASMAMLKRGVETMARGRISMAAAEIDVPLMLAFGERDVAANPLSEPAFYPRCRDLTLRIYPQMAHMHNFARNRSDLWDDLVEWASRFPLRGR